jgi:hypothetical protein
MNMPTRMFAVIAFLAILSGCSSIRTDNPVGISGGAQTDATLVGGWRVVEAQPKQIPPGGAGYLFFLPQKEGGYTGVWMAWNTPAAAKPDIVLFSIVTGRLGTAGIISARIVEMNGKPPSHIEPGYWPMLYRLDGNGRLHLFDASFEGIKLVENAVKSHRLAGTSEEQSGGKDASGKEIKTIHVRLTADPKSLDEYFAANASLIFTEPAFTFEHVD